MKTNFLKTVLPACVILLAITASFAFTSQNNDGPGDVSIAWETDSDLICILTTSYSVDCTTFHQDNLCTLYNGAIQVYGRNNPSSTMCSVILYQKR